MDDFYKDALATLNRLIDMKEREDKAKAVVNIPLPGNTTQLPGNPAVVYAPIPNAPEPATIHVNAKAEPIKSHPEHYSKYTYSVMGGEPIKGNVNMLKEALKVGAQVLDASEWSVIFTPFVAFPGDGKWNLKTFRRSKIMEVRTKDGKTLRFLPLGIMNTEAADRLIERCNKHGLEIEKREQKQ